MTAFRGLGGSAEEAVAPSETQAEAPAPRLHTVALGETLSGIAQKYYGTAKRWPEIYAANRDILRDERSLVAGRVLRIP